MQAKDQSEKEEMAMLQIRFQAVRERLCGYIYTLSLQDFDMHVEL